MQLNTGILALSFLVVAAGCGVLPELKTVPPPTPPVPATPPKSVTPVVTPTIKPPPKIALALGGGAVRGFAHVGVIKALESQGIKVDMVAGTSVGSVVGALYAAGHSGYALQKIALRMDEATVSDWSLPNRGFIKGEQLQSFINQSVQNRPIEKLKMILGVVVTNLQTGEQVVFRQGNTGMAVRASSSIPGIFQPVVISGKEYVDGGLTSPVPVNAARELGADIVIAVDISNKPKHGKVKDSIDVLLQTFSIMGQSIGNFELTKADVVIRPNTGEVNGIDFSNKHLAILEGEKAALEAVPLIREKILEFMGKRDSAATQAVQVTQTVVRIQAEAIKPAEVMKPVSMPASVPVLTVENTPILTPSDAETMYQLGLKQEREGNLAAALKSFHSAAYIGSGLAMKKLGDIYNVGTSLVRRDYSTAIKWYSKASEHGIHIPKDILKR